MSSPRFYATFPTFRNFFFVSIHFLWLFIFVILICSFSILIPLLYFYSSNKNKEEESSVFSKASIVKSRGGVSDPYWMEIDTEVQQH
jgi:hypothetical protein